MKDFFKVIDLDRVSDFLSCFSPVDTEQVPITEALGRVLGQDVLSDTDLPGFSRSTMDGFAVSAKSTFGASEANPAYLTCRGTVEMGAAPDFSVAPGEVARISTGGRLPEGADSVVMVEHTEAIDDLTIEIQKSVAPGQHVISSGEDFKRNEKILSDGQVLRPQEIGLLAAFGKQNIDVYRKPVISIISTGDEIVPIDRTPGPAEIRDINTYTLSGLIERAGAIPYPLGIVKDDYDNLFRICSHAQSASDMALISGGSSVGARDFTIAALEHLPKASIRIHGIAISPGKPTILAESMGKAFWGLPGHVVSAMVVFEVVVKPFIDRIKGTTETPNAEGAGWVARLRRNLSSAQGRVDFIRVSLSEEDGTLWADPVLGKSGLINTVVKADGLIRIGQNTEGLDRGDTVKVTPI